MNSLIKNDNKANKAKSHNAEPYRTFIGAVLYFN